MNTRSTGLHHTHTHTSTQYSYAPPPLTLGDKAAEKTSLTQYGATEPVHAVFYHTLISL